MSSSNPLAEADVAAERGGRRWPRRLLRGLGWTLASFALVVALAWLLLDQFILPRMDRWRQPIAAKVSQSLGIPVSLGRIEVERGGLHPRLALADVVLRDPRGREALRLREVHVGVALPALAVGRLRLDPLRIVAPQLEIRRDREGRLWVAGFDVEAEGGVGGDEGLDWLLGQREVRIERGEVRWVDDRRGAAPLALTAVDATLSRSGREHTLQLAATPPPAWGDPFRLAARMRHPWWIDGRPGRPGDLPHGDGQWRLDLPRADIARLREHLDLPWNPQAGVAALQASLDLRAGQPQAATLTARLHDVALQLTRRGPPLALKELQAGLNARRDAAGVSLRVDGLRFVTAEGRDWAPSRLDLRIAQQAPRADQLWPSAETPITGGRLDADRLDLPTLVALAGRLPLPEGSRALLATLRPHGVVQGLQAAWRGPPEAPTGWEAAARVVGSALAAGPAPQPGVPGRPGWQGVDAVVKATHAGGEATLTLRQGALVFPGVFADPVLPMDSLDAALAWKITPASAAGAAPAIQVEARDVRFANADTQGRWRATWRSGPGQGFGVGQRYPGLIDLEGEIAQGRAERVVRYLPLSLPAEVRRGVDAAVQAGTLREGRFAVRGDLWRFPYPGTGAPADGVFRIDTRVDGLRLAPWPAGDRQRPWAAFTDVAGRLRFDRDSLQFDGVSGRFGAASLQQFEGRIARLDERAVLELKGRADGPAAEMLRYVRQTPLDSALDHALTHAEASGPAQLQLQMALPLGTAGRTSFRVQVDLQGNSLRFGPDVPLLTEVQGRVDAHEQGFRLQGVRAKVAGGEARVEGGLAAGASAPAFIAEGRASLAALGEMTELGPVAPALRRAQQLGIADGEAPYRLALGWRQGRAQWTLDSSLQGTALRAPPPLSKAAADVWPLRVEVEPPAPEAAGDAAGRESWRLQLGPLQGRWMVDVRRPEAPVVASAWALGAKLPALQPEGHAVLHPGVTDVGSWLALARRWRAAVEPAQTASAPTAPGSAPAGEATAGSFGFPRRIDLRSPQLDWQGRRLTAVDAQWRETDPAGHWQLDLRSDQARGRIDWRPPGAAESPRWRARFERLQIPPRQPGSTSTPSAAVEVAAGQQELPELDIEVGRFEWGERLLGELKVHASQDRAAPPDSGRGWHLDALTLRHPHARLAASGRWWPAPPRRPGEPLARTTLLDVTLDVTDGGGLLHSLGWPGLLRGARGRLQGQLGWEGAPLDFDVERLDGGFAVAFDAGQFLKADAGAARLLGVLNLQALPRRLSLDFRDLFGAGFPFDHVRGHVKVRDGVASTEDLVMRGAQAEVRLAGKADIARETQDLRVVVLPELPTGGAALAYAAINPAVALGAFIGQWLLSEPLQQALMREFHIHGRWDDPRVDRVRGTGRERATPASAPASQSGASEADRNR